MSNYSKNGIITADDSDLRQSISKVMSEDAKSEQALNEAQYQKSKSGKRKTMTFTESCRLVSETAAADSLANYPGSNANTFTDSPNPDPRYYGDKEGVAPKQVANVPDKGESMAVQRSIVDAAHAISDLWGRLVDPRDKIKVRKFLKDAFSPLLDD